MTLKAVNAYNLRRSIAIVSIFLNNLESQYSSESMAAEDLINIMREDDSDPENINIVGALSTFLVLLLYDHTETIALLEGYDPDSIDYDKVMAFWQTFSHAIADAMDA